MDDPLTQPSTNPARSSQDGQFVKKFVETPILDSDLRQKIAASAEPVVETTSPGFFRANKYYFVAIFAGILIIAVLAFFAFRKAPAVAPKDANVAIAVDVPQTVASGGEAVYKIIISNNDPSKLASLQLELNYPDGVTYESSSPNAQNLSGTLFNVPDLISGQNASIFVKTKIAGNVNDEKILNLKLHYKYTNFNSEFIKEQSSTVRLVASDVLLELDGPPTTNNAQLVVYNIKYQNNSDADISNARIKIVYPDGFNFAQATPQPDLGNDTWSLSGLPKGGSSNIQIQGTFASANPGQSKTASVQFLILGQDGQYFVQNSSTFTTSISSLPLLVTQALQGSQSQEVVNPGDNLTFVIHYQNNAGTVATGMNIQATINSKAVDLTSLRAEGGQINNNTILWNASGVPQLASVLPNQSGDLSFTVNVKNPAVKDASKNLTVVTNIQIQSNEYQSAFPGNQLSLKISSPSSLSSSLNFVSGQLPPKVGLPTIYKVKISLTNSSNDYSSGVLTAFIPLASGGFNTSSVSGSEINNVQFDPSTGKLTWNVGSLPAETGKFSQPKVLEFQLTLNPSSTQSGQSPVLVKNISFTAQDLFTGQNVALSAGDIHTSDIQGVNGYGNGSVQN